MKIEKVKSREYKDKTYHKYRLIIPKDLIEKAGFKEGDELEAEARKGKIELERK